MSDNKALAARFCALFTGYEHAHGRSKTTDERREDGKLKTISWLDKTGPTTPALWEQHLAGTLGIGGIPIRTDDTALWAVVDLDFYEGSFNHPEVAAKIKALQIPAILAASKSGGGHVCVFAAEPIPAELFRERMTEICLLLGYDPKEVYPKQGEHTKEGGNWVNHIYYGGNESTRNAYKPNGDVYSTEEFLDAAEALKASCTREWFETPLPSDVQETVPKKGTAGKKATFVLAEKIHLGEQHNTLVAFAGSMRRNGADADMIFAALKEANKRCDKPGPEENLRNIARTVARYEPGGEGGKAGKGPNHADILLGMIGDFEYFKSGSANEAYVRMSIGDHRELWRVSDRDTKVREVLTHRFLVEHGRAPSREALNTAIDTIMAKCSMGQKVDVHVRFARSSDVIYLDLADEQWRAVEITKDGWRVVDNPPVLFRRASGARPLPVPVKGGALDQLRPLVNSGDDAQWLLMISWLVGVFLPEGAFVHLVLNGEQGSAKTSVALALVSVLDPSDAGLTSPPKDEVDATVSALHAGVLAYDNMSGCRADLSDVFCRFSTGQGYRVRTLYQNLGVTVASVKLPVIMNGISSTVMRGDLVERSIILKLPTIPPEQRLTEKGVVSDFAAMHAGVLGALLDVVATGLRNLPHTVLDRLPRMSDFALWISACEAALPWPAGRFLKTYFAKMKFANMDLVEGDTLASALVEWGERLAPGQNMQISTRELLTQLNDLTRGWPKDLKYWPASAEDLVHKLMRLAPVLRASDIDVRKLKRTGKMRSHWEISRTGPQIALVLPEAA
jgi:hypothetical protein